MSMLEFGRATTHARVVEVGPEEFSRCFTRICSGEPRVTAERNRACYMIAHSANDVDTRVKKEQVRLLGILILKMLPSSKTS